MYTMHYDHSRKTAVPTELLQDPYLSVDTKGLAAILCSFGKDAFELSKLADQLRENLSDEQELNLIRHKMRQLGTRNFGAYARKMLIDGYIIKVDYTEQKKLAAAVNKVAANINQICRRINSTGHFYEADIVELKDRLGDVWELLKARQKEEL